MVWSVTLVEPEHEYLRAIYDGIGHIYAPFTSYRLHYHQKLTARFTHPVTVIHL